MQGESNIASLYTHVVYGVHYIQTYLHLHIISYQSILQLETQITMSTLPVLCEALDTASLLHSADLVLWPFVTAQYCAIEKVLCDLTCFPTSTL